MPVWHRRQTARALRRRAAIASSDGLLSDLLAWGEQPDAFRGVLKIGALGWVGDP